MIFIGAIVYTNVKSIPSLVIAQTIMGLGCGTSGVTRAYVAETTAKKNRTTYLGYLTYVTLKK